MISYTQYFETYTLERNFRNLHFLLVLDILFKLCKSLA
jgi:hypothetical protein